MDAEQPGTSGLDLSMKSAKNNDYKDLQLGRDDEDDDEVVKLLKGRKDVTQEFPPDIRTDNDITNISFSPEQEMIVLGNINGELLFYEYSNIQNEITRTLRPHSNAVRALEYNKTGRLIISAGIDKKIVVIDSKTGRVVHEIFREHDAPVSSMLIITDNTFVTGDDQGYMKLWDQRCLEKSVSLKVSHESINTISSCKEGSTKLVCGANDGVVYGLDMNALKIIGHSQPYSAPITCSGLFYGDMKLVFGTAAGSIIVFQNGEFNQWNDEFPSPEKLFGANCLIPITDKVLALGMDSGSIRALHLFPMRNIGIIGKHENIINCMDISWNGRLCASSSDRVVSFWNIEYFENFTMDERSKRQGVRGRDIHLPSSSGINPVDFFAALEKSD